MKNGGSFHSYVKLPEGNQHDASAPASHCSSSISSDPRWISVAFLDLEKLSQGNGANGEHNSNNYGLWHL